MGDDAEYYMEQQQEEVDFQQALEYGRLSQNTKSLLCWIGDDEDEIWSWEPLSRIVGVFSNLHNLKHLGSDYFLADSIPFEDDWNDEPSEPVQPINPKFVNGLQFNIVHHEDQAAYEIIVLSQQDVAHLKSEAIDQKNSASSLKETMLSEMLQEMALFLEQNKQKNLFVFAREL